MVVQAAQGCQQVSVVMFHNKSFQEALRWGKSAEVLSEEAHSIHGDAAITIYVTSQINLISYYEKSGEFAAAEDALWKAIDVVGPHEEIFKRGEAFYQTCRKQADARLAKVGLTRAEVEDGHNELKERIQQSNAAKSDASSDGEETVEAE